MESGQVWGVVQGSLYETLGKRDPKNTMPVCSLRRAGGTRQLLGLFHRKGPRERVNTKPILAAEL